METIGVPPTGHPPTHRSHAQPSLLPRQGTLPGHRCQVYQAATGPIWALELERSVWWVMALQHNPTFLSSVHTHSYPRRGHRQLASVSQQRSSSQLASRRGWCFQPGATCSQVGQLLPRRVAKSPESQPPTLEGLAAAHHRPLPSTASRCLRWRPPLTRPGEKYPT